MRPNCSNTTVYTHISQLHLKSREKDDFCYALDKWLVDSGFCLVYVGILTADGMQIIKLKLFECKN